MEHFGNFHHIGKRDIYFSILYSIYKFPGQTCFKSQLLLRQRLGDPLFSKVVPKLN